LKKQPFLMYNDKLQQEIDTQLFLENELEKSIDRKELEVHYQPKLSWQPEN
jgi:sensor c-di-GMP phosphodiesterase-like protein